MPADLRVALLEHAADDGAVYGSKAVGEPPLMLALAVREALREAVGAFGVSTLRQAQDGAGSTSGSLGGPLASPATPEAVYWAIQAAKARA